MRALAVLALATTLLAQEGGGDTSLGPPEPNAKQAAAARKQLDETLFKDVLWKKKTVKEVVAALAKKAKVEITLTAKAAKAAGAKPFALEAKKITARQLLERLTSTSKLGWRIRKGKIVVHALSEAEGKVAESKYKVGHLFPKPDAKARHIDMHVIINEIAMGVMRWSWHNVEGQDIRPDKTTLIVHAIPDVQWEVHAYLERLWQERMKKK